ncbi:MAG: GGDEF domain-containing protein, partial [Elusimicrobia bacterium]|nr:GGDEF domain-containing protein [Candidatus Obscuribacterium magneticum]
HHFPFRETHVGEKITISVGVSSFPQAQVNSDQDLLEAADQALYAAKKAGRNQVWIFSKGELERAGALLAAGGAPSRPKPPGRK